MSGEGDNSMAQDHDMSPRNPERSMTDSVVFFDGVCGLCSSTVDFFMARDPSGKLKFAPLQGTTAQEIVPASVRESLNTFVYAEQGRLYYRSTAVVRILLQIGGFWGLAGRLLWLIPLPIRNLGYRSLAAVRYRLFGKHESCRLPTPEERQRFFD